MTRRITRIAFDMPYEVTDDDRRKIDVACPGIEIVFNEFGRPIDAFDGRPVSVLVGEELPQDLSKWPELQFVQLICSGFDHLKGHPIWHSGIPVSTASGNHSVPIAQYVTCVLLMLVHQMVDVLDFQRGRRNWSDRFSLGGFVLRGKTVGIVGYGSIGRECARQLDALGMRVLSAKRRIQQHVDHGFNPWPGSGDPEGIIPQRWFAPAQIDEMLPACDVLLVTAPATGATMGMIGAEQLARLKKGSRVIVASRGGIVDEQALADALRSGHLAGASVDSFVEEPPPRDHPLFDAPNVILTPHVSGVYEPYWPQGLHLVCENLRRLSAGEALLNRADGLLGY
jgi:phosphoglycerate dehydrogenase-like enzyme